MNGEIIIYVLKILKCFLGGNRLLKWWIFFGGCIMFFISGIGEVIDND